MAVPLSQVARLEEFPRSALEWAGSQQVVQYRNEILPLIYVDRMLRIAKGKSKRRRNGKRPATNGTSSTNDNIAVAALSNDDTVQVVVYAEGTRRMGLVAGNIIDIVEEVIESRSAASRPGVQFSAVVQGRVTEFLDIEWVMRAVATTNSTQSPYLANV